MSEIKRPPHGWTEVPEGHEVVARWAGPHWQLDSGHRCRYARQGREVCGKPSVAALLRGFKRPRWWAYCPVHMYGKWAEDGQVMQWILVKKEPVRR